MKRTAAVIVVLLLCVSTADARRRSVRSGPSLPPNTGTPAGWLAANAHALTTTDLISDRSDLAPLGPIVGSAGVVGLGDGTHGTREFYTVKLRILDYLVHELDFDVVSFEASFPLFDRINAYVQGGPGDPRALLGEAGKLGYPFWDSEEILAVVEWMRDYNAHRGARPAISIAGADVWEPRPAAEAVIAYLQTVDPAAAGVAGSDYQCVLKLTGLFSIGCNKANADAAFARLAARRTDLGSGAGAPAYEEALQSARVVVQSFSFSARDENMAANVQWLRDHRSQSHRVVYWAHSEHAGKASTPQVAALPAGRVLQNALGSGYVAIGTLTGSGEYRTWIGTGPVAYPVPAPTEGTYENYFQLAARPAVLIPLRGSVPAWLSGPARYFFAGAAPADPYISASLPEKFDAVVYVHATTPIRMLTH
jgi:erythromycin esterase